MLDSDLVPPITWQRLRSGLAAEHLRDFTGWLRDRAYKPISMRSVLRRLAAWTDWMHQSGFTLTDAMDGLAACKATIPTRRHGSRAPNRESVAAASLFIRFLQERGVLPRPKTSPSALDTWPLLAEFCRWQRQHRGLRERTLDGYQHILVDLLVALGDKPETYTATLIRDFVLQRAKSHSQWHARGIATAVRVFLRFLSASGRTSVRLDQSVPQYPTCQLSSVPRYLEPAQVERVIDACVANDTRGLRDRAVMLLLVRLALRASDVANLAMRDIDWQNGRLAVCGKGRRQEWLPLPQDAGDALLRYIREGRPRTASDHVFAKVWAPQGTLTSFSVTQIARSALRRAGVKAPINGAHVFRHSAATAMLRSGVSLAGVGAVLRHRSPNTTLIYAKVDAGLLREIAQPWPEVTSC